MLGMCSIGLPNGYIHRMLRKWFCNIDALNGRRCCGCGISSPVGLWAESFFGTGGDVAAGVGIGLDAGSAIEAGFLEFTFLTQPPGPRLPFS